MKSVHMPRRHAQASAPGANIHDSVAYPIGTEYVSCIPCIPLSTIHAGKCNVCSLSLEKSRKCMKMLTNAPTLAIVAVHTAENEPLKIWEVIQFNIDNCIILY